MAQFFTVVKKDKNSQARVGEIKTLHGTIETPTFIPDATYGCVKHVSSQELNKIGLQIILGNIYHLGLRPGTKIIKKLGGLHGFMNWQKPIITDSGGWQVFSLVYQHKMGKVRENGIEFRDPLTGLKHFLTPEKSLQMQLEANSDILMVLDYPIIGEASEEDNKISVSLTTEWAKQSLKAFLKSKNHHGKILMPIIQGASSQKMRKKSYESLSALGDFPGFGFGGPPTDKKILRYTASLIPENKIRYLMGGERPKELLAAVKMGYDLFDCVVPTRNARHGLAYTFQGEIRITQQKYLQDKKPLEKDCPCLACQNYSQAYIRHLLKVGEPLGQRLMTIHNLTFYVRLMQKIRGNIKREEPLDKVLKNF